MPIILAQCYIMTARAHFTYTKKYFFCFKVEVRTYTSL